MPSLPRRSPSFLCTITSSCATCIRVLGSMTWSSNEVKVRHTPAQPYGCQVPQPLLPLHHYRQRHLHQGLGVGV